MEARRSTRITKKSSRLSDFVTMTGRDLENSEDEYEGEDSGDEFVLGEDDLRLSDENVEFSESDGEESNGVSEQETSVPILKQAKRTKARGSASKGPKKEERNWLPVNVEEEVGEKNFRMTPGLKIEVPGAYNPIDLFLFLFGGAIYNIIIRETNRYANSKTMSLAWIDITEEELSAFFGCMIVISFRKISRLSDIWHPNCFRSTPVIAAIFTKARFFQILANLHFSNSEVMPKFGEKNYSRLYRIEKIISQCNVNFRACYQLSREIAIDESITKFKGRNSMKQYDPSKPIKRGFKWWVLADSKNGYVYNMKMYEGAEVVVAKPGDTSKLSVHAGVLVTKKPVLGLGTRAVLSVLTPELYHKNHVLFCDRFFSSLSLQKELSRLGVYICGTIRKDRLGIPESLKTDFHLKRGESKFVLEQGGTGLQLVVWMDSKPIYFINNNYPPTGDDTVGRKQPNGAVLPFPCPPAVKMYNSFMNGVDLADQKRIQYGVSRKSNRWPMRLFWHCFDTAIVNAHILHTEYWEVRDPKNVQEQLDFRTDLAQSLIGVFTNRKQKGRTSVQIPPQPRLGPVNHKIVDLRVHNQTQRRRCLVCRKNKIRKDTFYGCHECNNIPLCNSIERNCFNIFHSENF